MAGRGVIEVQGLDAALRGINALPDKLLPALARALHDEAEQVMARSKELVPLDIGALQASGTVHEPEIAGGVVTQEMTYGRGDGTDAYAMVQHEDLSLRHPNGRQAKYLEGPALEAARGMGERIGNRAARELGRG